MLYIQFIKPGEWNIDGEKLILSTIKLLKFNDLNFEKFRKGELPSNCIYELFIEDVDFIQTSKEILNSINKLTLGDFIVLEGTLGKIKIIKNGDIVNIYFMESLRPLAELEEAYDKGIFTKKHLEELKIRKERYDENDLDEQYEVSFENWKKAVDIYKNEAKEFLEEYGVI